MEHKASQADACLRLVNVGLKLKDGTRLLDSVSCQFPEAGLSVILGETGSGKTLLAKILAGLWPAGAAPEGQVFFAGRPLLNGGRRGLACLRGREVIWVPQDGAAALNPLMRCDRQITLPLRKVLKLSRREAGLRAAAWLDALELEPEAIFRAHPYELSGGMKVRFMVAIAMAMEARLLILDEPTKALDDEQTRTLMNLVCRRAEANKVKLIMITHDLNLAARSASSCLVLRGGRVDSEGPAETVLQTAKTPYVRALWDALPENGMKLTEAIL